MTPNPPSRTRAADLPAVCHSLMERSPVPMAELEGASQIVRYVNPAFCVLTGKSREMLTGKPFAQTVQEGDTCLAVLDRVFRTGETETHTEPEHSGSHPAYWSYAMWPVLDDEQRPAGVMMQVTETTAFHREAGAMNEALLISSVRQHELTEEAENLNGRLRGEMARRLVVENSLRESEESYRMLVSQVKDYAIFGTDLAGRATTWNEGVKEILGFNKDEFIGQDIVAAIFTPEDIRAGVAERELRTAAVEGSANDDRWLCRKDGERFFAQGMTVARKGNTGEAIGFTKIFRDVTERKRAEERERLLARELAHRSKNLLSVFQAIVSRSLAGTRSIGEAREALMRRIQALARSQIVLESGGFESAPLSEILRLETEAFSDRVRGDGPEVRLNPKAAQTFALVVHELVTNATKHGALSEPGGWVDVNWSINGENDRAKFDFQWRELGGPPVAPPTRQGFGRVLIEKVVAHEFGAQPEITFAPEGLNYEIVAPLSLVAAGDTN